MTDDLRHEKKEEQETSEFTASSDTDQYNEAEGAADDVEPKFEPVVEAGNAAGVSPLSAEDAQFDWMALMGANATEDEENHLDRRALLVFCRAPRLGEVKTRLAKETNEEFALGLYRAMLHDTFALCDRLPESIEIVACHWPENAFETEPSLEIFWDGSTLAQYGATLGERMGNAMTQLREEEFGSVAVIGSDAPDLDHERVEVAFEHLERYDVVVGPTEDNGFYLLATRVPLPPSFFAEVFDPRYAPYHGVIRACRSHRLRLRRLMPWTDVDTERDVNLLATRLRVGTARALHTRRYLGANGYIRGM